MPEPGTESIFIKLKKEFFSLENDVFVCFVYLVPSSSAVLHRDHMPDDLFEDIQTKLAKYDRRGDIIILGDLNSRTGGLQEYIRNDSNEHLPVLPLYTDTEATFDRHSQDTNVNSYGRKFIDLCRSVPLRILNGRKLGDLMGNFTCQNPRGRSVVDYCAASPSLFNKISYFRVGHLMPVHSDHCPVDISLKVSVARTPLQPKYVYVSKPDKVQWSKDRQDAFINAIQSPACTEALDGFLGCGIMPNQESVDQANAFITNIYRHSAELANMPLRQGAVPRRSAREDQRRARPPRWHDAECRAAYSAVQVTARMLSQGYNNPYLRGKLFTESKKYNKIVKSKQKEYMSGIFDQLEQVRGANPRKYMDLVRSLRQGSFDKKTPSDTEGIGPQEWFNHFRDLLGPVRPDTDHEKTMRDYIELNRSSVSSDLDLPFSKSELLKCVKSLKNNKATGFDCISNEMLKCSAESLHKPLLRLFNTILQHSIYPAAWKEDILGPLFKAGVKTDCNNFRGICVSSCLGKLFKSLLRSRLESKCIADNLIPMEQCSGRVKARTADHLLVFQHIINKYVKLQNKTLFVCFFDLSKAYDKISRIRLFYDLLTEYKVGGKYLAILQNMYSNNKMHIRLDEGLTQPFTTTTGVFQGCNISPQLFNLYTSKLPSIYNDQCDPVYINQQPVNVLAWADDAAVFSLSKAGMQMSIDRTIEYYKTLGLSVNINKTKVMIFNKRGLKPQHLPQCEFTAEGRLLEVAEQYTYLGAVYIPSGAVYAAIDALTAKCSRAWFSISNILYENKRMPVDKCLKLVDSLVFPVGQYATEFLAPMSLPAKSFNSKEQLLRAWEGFYLEVTHQRVCRLVLSVQKKTSRLAVLGELGRYPMLIKSLVQSIMYERSILKYQPAALVGRAVAEMSSASDDASWLARVRKIRMLLNIPLYPSYMPDARVSRDVSNKIKSQFDVFYLEEINKIKLGNDGLNHNKLRFYATFKGSFKSEYYIDNINNRNQRAWLSRLRTSSHHLEVEKGRYTGTPYNERWCRYCPPACEDSFGRLGTEEHFLHDCTTFANQRRCFFAKYSQLFPIFPSLSREEKVRSILCPASNAAAKLINKYISIMSKGRDKIEEGLHPTLLTFPPQVVDYCPPLSDFSFSSNASEGSMVGHVSGSESEYFSESDN
jgi:exonuclease III